MNKPTKTLLVPAVHLNGTGEKSLLDSIEKAHHAAREAYDALRETAPNGRDYYVYSPEAYDRARTEYLDRMTAIDSVIQELEALAIGIQDRVKEVEVR